MTLPVLVPIPSPELPGELEQLAQISTPDGVVEAFWFRHHGQRRYAFQFGRDWFTSDDCNIVDCLGELVAVKSSLINLNGDVDFCERGGKWSTAYEITQHFYNCDWSDYAVDGMVFQATVRYPLD